MKQKKIQIGGVYRCRLNKSVAVVVTVREKTPKMTRTGMMEAYRVQRQDTGEFMTKIAGQLQLIPPTPEEYMNRIVAWVDGI